MKSVLSLLGLVFTARGRATIRRVMRFSDYMTKAKALGVSEARATAVLAEQATRQRVHEVDGLGTFCTRWGLDDRAFDAAWKELTKRPLHDS